jgi:hypothetical protein
MKANIYSVEPLVPVAREAIHEGISIVAGYMGEPVTTKELTVKLPRTPEGYVRPEKVGFSNFDMMVELHLLAVPLQGGAERPGVANLGRGVSFADTNVESKPLMRIITAHEVAHSLGFVLADSKQVEKDKGAHCIEDSCIMNREVTTATETRVIAPDLTRMERLRGKKPALVTETVVRLVNGQYDFCGDCKVDLYQHGQAELNKMRWQRLFHTKKV